MVQRNKNWDHLTLLLLLLMPIPLCHLPFTPICYERSVWKGSSKLQVEYTRCAPCHCHDFYDSPVHESWRIHLLAGTSALVQAHWRWLWLSDLCHTISVGGVNLWDWWKIVPDAMRCDAKVYAMWINTNLLERWIRHLIAARPLPKFTAIVSLQKIFGQRKKRRKFKACLIGRIS